MAEKGKNSGEGSGKEEPELKKEEEKVRILTIERKRLPDGRYVGDYVLTGKLANVGLCIEAMCDAIKILVRHSAVVASKGLTAQEKGDPRITLARGMPDVLLKKKTGG